MRGEAKTKWCSLDASPEGPLCAHGADIIDAPHCASFFADTLGAQVHELGGRCKRPDPVPVPVSV